MPRRTLAAFVALMLLEVESANTTILVSGATGRTGFLLWQQLRTTIGNDSSVLLRVLVRNVDKARKLLNCSKCDESEGVYVGDITKPETIANAMLGVDALAICTASSYRGTPPNVTYPTDAAPIDIDWHGNRNQVTELARVNNGRGHVVLISSMGTTNPDSFDGKFNYNFYKLNTEAYLMSAGVTYTIIKPCYLTDKPAEQRELVVGHDDSMGPVLGQSEVSRADVARVAQLALARDDVDKGLSHNLRFDLCTKAGTPQTTIDALRDVMRDARQRWQRSSLESRSIVHV